MRMEPGTRTRLTTILILFLVLVTGSVLGIAVDRQLEARAASGEARWRWSGEGRSGESRGGEERQGEEPSRRGRLIVEQVGLTEAQKIQVDSIVAHYRREMRNLQEELQADLQTAYMPRYRDLLEETRVEIGKLLTPEQRTVYDSLLVEHDQRREQQRRDRDSLPDSGG
jgi:Spy/CpxP family protein refolding chaperone